jgi:hypothetical protein
MVSEVFLNAILILIIFELHLSNYFLYRKFKELLHSPVVSVVLHIKFVLEFHSKEPCNEIFYLCFFSSNSFPEAPDAWVNPICCTYGLEFAKIFDFEIADFSLSGVNDTAVTKNNP